MSIQTELTRITNAKAAIKSAIEGKGVTVPDATLLDGMAALIDGIEAGGGGGAGELFHAEITPATSGEVLTFEVGEKGERIAAMILSIKVDTKIDIGKNYGLFRIAAANSRPVNKDPSLTNIIEYREGPYINNSSTSASQYRSSTPNGQYSYKSYNVWNSTSDKPLVKFYVTNGEESKYGLLVGKTYDIWVIKD